jgi:hypothetical protein
MTGWYELLLPHWLDPAEEAEGLLLSKLREYVARSPMAISEFELACFEDADEDRRDLAAYCLARVMQERDSNLPQRHAIAGGRQLLEQDLSPTVIRELVVGLGRSGDPTGLAVIGLADHESPTVREAVATVVPNLFLDGIELAQPCVSVLTRLAQDSAASVREWAVFGLVLLIDAGVSDDRASAAVVAAGADPDAAVREEARGLDSGG